MLFSAWQAIVQALQPMQASRSIAMPRRARGTAPCGYSDGFGAAFGSAAAGRDAARELAAFLAHPVLRARERVPATGARQA